jgi:hypothetical protein
MKTRLLFLVLGSFVILVMTNTQIFGQTPASVTWNLIAPDSQNVSTTVGNVTGQPISGTNAFVLISYSGAVAGGPGPLGQNFMRWNPGSGVSWGPEIAPVDSHYVQFVATPKPGNDFTVDSVSMFSSGGGTGTMKAFVYYSTDPTFATKTKISPDTIALPNSSASYVRLAYPVGTTVKSGKSLYVRYYPWYTGAASSSKYFYTQLAVILGKTTASATGIAEEKGAVPTEMKLQQNYPNPFNPSTNIEYRISKSGIVTLKVFDVLGREVVTLVNAELQPGVYQATFDGAHLASGVYLYQLRAGDFVQTRRMALAK